MFVFIVLLSRIPCMRIFHDEVSMEVDRMSDLNFYWRMGDYALEACPKRLARLNKDEPNETCYIASFWELI